MRTVAGMVVLSKVATARDAKLTQRFVAKCREPFSVSVEEADITDHRQQIDDRLRVDAWNGRAPDVVDLHEMFAEHLGNCRSLARELCRPARLMRNEVNVL